MIGPWIVSALLLVSMVNLFALGSKLNPAAVMLLVRVTVMRFWLRKCATLPSVHTVLVV